LGFGLRPVHQDSDSEDAKANPLWPFTECALCHLYDRWTRMMCKPIEGEWDRYARLFFTSRSSVGSNMGPNMFTSS
jgi:hypothetical protein